MGAVVVSYHAAEGSSQRGSLARHHRRLAAIVVADVVGYTRLMERDEAGTHARLREIRTQIVDPRIAAHGGRIVRTTGDGMSSEQGSRKRTLSVPAT